MIRSKKQTTSIVLLMLSLLFVLSSCSLFAEEKDEYLESLKSLGGSLWISTSKYNSSYDKKTPMDFTSIVWEEAEKNQSLAFINKSQVFVGVYENEVLSYGRYFSIDDTNKPIFLFSHESFVATENHLNTKIPEADRQSFTQTELDEAAGGDSAENYFISKEFSRGVDSWSSSFYLLDDNTLIRQNIYDSDSKVALIKYTRQ
ncbi:hypothetical protein [Candidatus Enterococcus clewellii]|uniref:Lipoprotein n=1 Tax=Candidatus Enterococcus clewellii TaxID=1834193 RepID=A0A242JXJ3_9ENTE|nr:hypothetical protein [Enterococcus sp. 9E7_DIV0242]OTP09839.1 hypothetical protein A5888_004035 [Enterococcus sp. 9E7_DIV0242]